MKKIIAFFISFFFIVSSNAQEIDLRLNLEVGKEYTQVLNSETTVVQSISGQQNKIVVALVGHMTYLVKNFTDVYDIEVNYKSLAMEMKMPQGQTMSFSSEKDDPQDMFSSFLREMINKPFNIKLASNGKVTEIKNIDKLFQGIFDNFPQLQESQKAQIKSQLMQSYGEDAFKGNMEMVTAIFPDKPVLLNDQWDVDIKLETIMAMDIEATYELIEVGDEYYMINGLSDIATADKDAIVMSNGIPLTYDLSGIIVSDIKVDKKSGWILEALIKQDLSGDAYIKESEQMPGGLKIPMNMKAELNVTDQ